MEKFLLEDGNTILLNVIRSLGEKMEPVVGAI
jgi:hypothetical protein